MPTDLFVIEHLAPVFYKLLYMSLAALCIGVVILLVRRFADGKISPFWKCAIWLLVLVCLILPYRPQSNTALLNNVERVQEVSFRSDELALRQELKDYKTQFQPEDAGGKDWNSGYVELNAKIEQAHLRSVIFQIIVPAVWLFGFIAFTLFLFISRIRLSVMLRRHRLAADERYSILLKKCKARLGIKSDIEIIVQSYIGSPALLGIFNPKIILPKFADDMSDESVEYILLHELAHYKRFDMFLNLTLIALQAVYWFNPLVWVLFRFIRQDMELANDAYVLKHIGNDKQKQYSLSLVEVLAQFSKISFAPKLLCMVDGKDNMERRIKMLKLGDVWKKRRIVIAAVSLVIICVVGAVFLTSGFGRNEIPQFTAQTLNREPNSSVKVTLGTYNWDFGKEKVVVDSLSPEQMRFDEVLNISPMERLLFIADDRQTDVSIKDKMYYHNGNYYDIGDVTIDRHAVMFSAPEELGEYIYVIILEFEYGVVNYVFKVVVENSAIALNFDTMHLLRTPYVGNNSAVGKIIDALPKLGNEYTQQFFSISDDYGTHRAPLTLTLYYESSGIGAIDEKNITVAPKNALLLFLLVENLEEVNYAFRSTQSSGELDKSAYTSRIAFSRDDISDYLSGIGIEWADFHKDWVGTIEQVFSTNVGTTSQNDRLEKPPSLDVIFATANSTAQSVRAAQLTYSWSYTDKNGNSVGVEADSMGPLQLQDYAEVTLGFHETKGEFALKFGDNYLPQSVSIRRWDAKYAGDNSLDVWGKNEMVDGNVNRFAITNDGRDYIYEVRAEWPNGNSYYVFRINSNDSVLINNEDIYTSDKSWEQPSGYAAYRIYVTNTTNETMKMSVKDPNSRYPYIIEANSDITITINDAQAGKHFISFSTNSGVVSGKITVTVSDTPL